MRHGIWFGHPNSSMVHRLNRLPNFQSKKLLQRIHPKHNDHASKDMERSLSMISVLRPGGTPKWVVGHTNEAWFRNPARKPPLGCINPAKFDELPTSTGACRISGCHQQYVLLVSSCFFVRWGFLLMEDFYRACIGLLLLDAFFG